MGERSPDKRRMAGYAVRTCRLANLPARLGAETMPHPPMTPPGTELRRVRSLIADLDGIVWEADANSMTFTFVSEGVRDILGYEIAEWLDEPSFWADHLHPEDRERLVG